MLRISSALKLDDTSDQVATGIRYHQKTMTCPEPVDKAKSAKPVLKALGISVGGAVFSDLLILPAIRWIIPIAPVAIYNVAATAIALLFAIGFVWMAWTVIRTLWSFLTKRQLWKTLRKEVQQWPKTKTDALLAVEMAWMIALLATTIVFFSSIPQDTSRLVAREVGPKITLLMLPALIPLSIQFYVAIYRETKQQWASGTRGTRIGLVTTGVFVVAAYVITLLGDFAGWEHMLWFHEE